MNDLNIYLHSLTPIYPRKVYDQSLLVDWVANAHEESALLQGQLCDKRRLKKFSLHKSYISQRYMECPDTSDDWKNNEIYRITPEAPYGVDIKKRNDFFSECALKRLAQSYENKKNPDHFIHVTCTGYIAPSAPQVYFANTPNAPEITHAYHMGCYASLPSIRLAKSLAAEGKMVDIFHNEICSIHMNPSNHSPEHIVVETLFADGHIGYQISREQKGFKILGVKEKIIPDTSSNMGWIPSSHGMMMTLTRDVPLKIQENILSFVMEMISDFNLDLAHIIKKGVFAIHPGGPRIIEVVKNKLEIRDDQIKESKKVLFERGNMSSATLPHIWHEIEQSDYPKGTYVLSLAFGPGLTVFGSVFEVS